MNIIQAKKQIFFVRKLILLIKLIQNITDGPAVVRINLFVRSIATISDIKMVSLVSTTTFEFLLYIFA